jgi:tellurite resistance protein
MSQEISASNRLAFFPINIFGAIMGYCGLTVALNHAHQVLDISEGFYIFFAMLTSLFFTLATIAYLIKLIKYPQAVVNEINHPIALNFFPTFSISLLLLSLVFKDLAYDQAKYMWILGALIQFSLLLYILNNWIHHEKWQITHMNPAWFIPVVGNILVPIGAVHFAHEHVGWFFFSIGLVFWIILNSVVMYRLFFHPPMMKVLEPTLFILIAPPAVGFIAYMGLQGMAGVNEFARILYYIGLFLTILLFSQIPRFIKVPFALSWWAYSFPLAAITIATFIMFEQLEFSIFKYLAIFLLATLVTLVLHLTVKTLWAIKNKKLCVPLHTPESTNKDS